MIAFELPAAFAAFWTLAHPRAFSRTQIFALSWVFSFITSANCISISANRMLRSAKRSLDLASLVLSLTSMSFFPGSGCPALISCCSRRSSLQYGHSGSEQNGDPCDCGCLSS